MRLALTLATTVLLLFGPSAWSQQSVIRPVVELDFDRPEAWALKYFNSVSFLNGYAPPEVRPPGSVDLAVEAVWVPHLDREERRVGFGGRKVEDLNKLPVLVRPRIRVGLPFKVVLDAGYVPPATINGVTPNLFSLALERPIWLGDPWSLGIRSYGQWGDVVGDFTCSEEDASHPPGSPENAYGCRERSGDRATLRHGGLAVTGGYRLGADGRSSLYGSVAVNYIDSKFQVNAFTFDVLDRTLQTTDGFTTSINLGVTFPANDRIGLAVEAFYSPLDVRRDDETKNEPLLNLRLLARYRLD